MKKFVKMFLVLFLCCISLPLTVCAGQEELDKNKDGRVQQGYIIIGESHVGTYQTSMEYVQVRNIATPNGNNPAIPVQWVKVVDGAVLKAPDDTRSAYWLVATPTGPIDPSYNYINTGDGGVKIQQIIDSNPQIEHWNLIVSWGTNNVALTECRGSYTEYSAEMISNALKVFKARYAEPYYTVYYATMPLTVQSRWSFPDHDKLLSYLYDYVAGRSGELGIQYRDLTSRWKGWQDQYLDSLSKGLTTLPDDYALDKDNKNLPTRDLNKWDGCHVTYKAYQDVYGGLIQEIENQLGGPYDINRTDSDAYIPYESMKFVNGTGNTLTAKTSDVLSGLRGNNDNGFIDSFYAGLKGINVPLTLIGSDELKCDSADALVWNIWKKYDDVWDKDDCRNYSCWVVVHDHWLTKTQSDITLSAQLIPAAFSELKYSSPLTMYQLTNKAVDAFENNTALAVSSIYSSRNALKTFSIVLDNCNKYHIVSKVSDDTITLESGVDIKHVNGVLIDSPLVISNLFTYTYTGNVTAPTTSITPPSNKDVTPASINVQERTIDIVGFNGTAQFIWASDLHILSKNDISRKPDIANRYTSLAGKEHDGEGILYGIVQYANSKGVPLILGGDIVDYASDSNYQIVKDALSTCTVPYVYIRADHDVDPNAITISGWSESQAKAESDKIPGTFTDAYKVLPVNGINLFCYNFSTNRSDNSSMYYNFDGTPTVLCTHVPFEYGATDGTQTISQFTESFRKRIYNWGSGSTYNYSNNVKAKTLRDAIMNGGIMGVFSGHTHTFNPLQFNGTNNAGLNVVEENYSAAFNGNVFLVTLK